MKYTYITQTPVKSRRKKTQISSEITAKILSINYWPKKRPNERKRQDSKKKLHLNLPKSFKPSGRTRKRKRRGRKKIKRLCVISVLMKSMWRNICRWKIVDICSIQIACVSILNCKLMKVNSRYYVLVVIER